jgi:hypothetical protein
MISDSDWAIDFLLQSLRYRKAFFCKTSKATVSPLVCEASGRVEASQWKLT